MKKNKFVLLTATGLLLTSLAGIKAFADDDNGAGTTSPAESIKKTETTVEITDKTENDDDKGPEKDELALKHVPTQFNFTTALKDKEYTVDAKADGIVENKIDVFNNKSERKWQVTATLGDGSDAKIINTKDGVGYDVTSFEIAGKEIIGTAKSGVVHENIDTTIANNTSTISKDVNEIKIVFNDPQNKLKVADKLTGTINYTIGLTPAGE